MINKFLEKMGIESHGNIEREDLYEYQLVATPDEAVGQLIMEEKRQFSQQFSDEGSAIPRPQIAVSDFLARDEMEDTLIRWLQRIVGEQKSFRVTLNNYSGQPADSVYLRVQDPAPFKELAVQLKPIDFYITSNDCPPVKFVTHPHMNIAKKLSASVYQKAIAEYARKIFHESFYVTELVLLRRRHSHDSSRQVAIFRLQPPETYSS